MAQPMDDNTRLIRNLLVIATLVGIAELAELDVLLNFSSTGIRTVEVLPLWQAPFFFLLLVLLKVSEWGLRRFWGRI